MITRRVQRICWCVQCEERLPDRCEKCVKHPDRRPRVVEIYDAPPVLATNECGCVKIRCQRDGCLSTMWRHPRADGTLGYKNHFHEPACVRVVTAAARKAQRVTRNCSCGCGKKITRPASNMRAKQTYFSQLHHFQHRVALKSEARRAREKFDVQAKVCDSPRCRGVVTDHTRTPTGLFACVRCNARTPEAPLHAMAA